MKSKSKGPEGTEEQGEEGLAFRAGLTALVDFSDDFLFFPFFGTEEQAEGEGRPWLFCFALGRIALVNFFFR